MPILRKWIDLPRAEKRLFFAAAWWVVIFRLALWTLPLRIVMRLGERSARSRNRRPREDDIVCVPRAVLRAARFVPRATCLTQSLSMHTLLGRRGITTQLRFGVTKSPSGQLLAHAWLEKDGAKVVPTEDLGDYLAFPAIQLRPTDSVATLQK
jgi:Transglutaminase-like superfamily